MILIIPKLVCGSGAVTEYVVHICHLEILNNQSENNESNEH
jgi:hypothetical protein